MDEFNRKINKMPLQYDGNNFVTHFLTKSEGGFIEFSPCTFKIIPHSLLIGIPFLMLFIDIHDMFKLFLFTWILIFSHQLIKFGMPIYFDKDSNIYNKGYRNRFLSSIPCYKTEKEDLSNIYALQFLGKFCNDEDKSYWSYELNLVFNNGDRKNIVDHSDYELLLEDATKLAEFLGVPLLNSANENENN